eukprot:SAG31_NODE_26404_length_443_cov_0.598837_1_plen_61_part_10
MDSGGRAGGGWSDVQSLIVTSVVDNGIDPTVSFDCRGDNCSSILHRIVVRNCCATGCHYLI